MRRRQPLPQSRAARQRPLGGADRRARSCSVRSRRWSCVCGTATTIDFLTADGEFEGGVILPGVGLMLRALHQHTGGAAGCRRRIRRDADANRRRHRQRLPACAGRRDRTPLPSALTGAAGTDLPALRRRRARVEPAAHDSLRIAGQSRARGTVPHRPGRRRIDLRNRSIMLGSSEEKTMAEAREVVILSGVRTAIGDYGGSLKDIRADRAGGARGAGGGRPRQGRPEGHRPMRVRQRDPHRSQGHVPVARGLRQRRAAGGHRRADGEPPVRQRHAGHRLGVAVHPARRRRCGGRRRRGKHEPRRLRQPHAALGRAHGRRQGRST